MSSPSQFQAELEILLQERDLNIKDAYRYAAPSFQPALDSIVRSTTKFEGDHFGEGSTSKALDSADLVRIEITNTLRTSVFEPRTSAITQAKSIADQLGA